MYNCHNDFLGYTSHIYSYPGKKKRLNECFSESVSFKNAECRIRLREVFEVILPYFTLNLKIVNLQMSKTNYIQ